MGFYNKEKKKRMNAKSKQQQVAFKGCGTRGRRSMPNMDSLSMCAFCSTPFGLQPFSFSSLFPFLYTLVLSLFTLSS